ncbi:MAG: FkbM family methyltransferase [Mobilitalea sp.]
MIELNNQINIDFDNFDKTLTALKNSPYQNIVLGAGERGVKLIEKLKEWQIEVADCLVNRKYASEEFIFRGVLFHIFEDEIHKYQKVNLITAFPVKMLTLDDIHKDKINMIVSLNIGVYDDYLYTKEFYELNYEKLNYVYNLLSDELSKKLFEQHISGRILGQYVNDLIFSKNSDGYIYEEIIKWDNDETIIDAGAFDGDTANEFLTKTKNKVNKLNIICFEPDHFNFTKLCEKYSDNSSIQLFEAGLWRESTTLNFNNGEEGLSAVDDNQNGNTTITVVSLDEFFSEKEYYPTFIKMDIEGSEVAALEGAQKLIRRYSPKLAICLYHKKEDLFEIPLMIRSYENKYKFYVRKHINTPSELVLYAIIR